MNKALRLSEKWFRSGLWLVAVAFAGFLIGLGGTVVRNLPQVEQRLGLEDFIDQPAARQARAAIEQARQARQAADEALDQARLKLNAQRADAASARETYANWLAARQATRQPEQDAELIRRSAALDALKAAERRALAAVEAQQQAALDARQAEERARRTLQTLEAEAAGRLDEGLRRQELRVFLYRLALTLPLLAAAGWLFARQRRSTWWPFVWGFVFFALFTFFVELVPYLPDYGGYVRHVVGIVVTVVVGRQAILALNRYLERQKLAEARPDAERRPREPVDRLRRIEPQQHARDDLPPHGAVQVLGLLLRQVRQLPPRFPRRLRVEHHRAPVHRAVEIGDADLLHHRHQRPPTAHVPPRGRRALQVHPRRSEPAQDVGLELGAPVPRGTGGRAPGLRRGRAVGEGPRPRVRVVADRHQSTPHAHRRPSHRASHP